jgi:hypothetical protein
VALLTLFDSTETVDDETRAGQNRFWYRRTGGVEPERADEPRHVDLAVVHHSPLRAPVHAGPQFRKPRARSRLVDQPRRIRNPASLIVREYGVGRVEQRQLRHCI